MKTKNKRIISVLLSGIMAFSFAGCSKVGTTFSEFITKVKEYTSSNSSDEQTTTEEITTEITTILETTKAPTTKETTTSETTTKETTTKETTTKKQPAKETTNKNTDFLKYACVIDNVNLRKGPSLEDKVITVIDKFQKIEIIEELGDWDYVSFGNTKGYVSSKYVKDLGKTFVEVDISEQNLYLYVDDELSLSADVVTGKKNTYDTRLGCHPIYSKETSRYLTGEDYKVYVDYWMPFDKGQGLHDASWRKDFSDDAYVSGSHGCVNMKYADAKRVYNNVKVGTLVLVHK